MVYTDFRSVLERYPDIQVAAYEDFRTFGKSNPNTPPMQRAIGVIILALMLNGLHDSAIIETSQAQWRAATCGTPPGHWRSIGAPQLGHGAKVRTGSRAARASSSSARAWRSSFSIDPGSWFPTGSHWSPEPGSLVV